MKKKMTLCYLQNDSQILLGLKKKGFGEGRWNGFGGKVEAGELAEQAAARELEEEAGIKALILKKRGVLDFEFKGQAELLEVHIFSASEFEGELLESDEMKPQWFDFNDIPYDKMWPDDRHWLPLFLAGKNFSGHFYFRDINTLINHTLEEREEIIN